MFDFSCNENILGGLYGTYKWKLKIFFQTVLIIECEQDKFILIFSDLYLCLPRLLFCECVLGFLNMKILKELSAVR